MHVTYAPQDPADGDRGEWDFDPDRVRQSAAEMIEKRYGDRYAEFIKQVQAGEARARRVLLWHLMSKTHPTLRLENVPDFYMGELEVDYSVSDLQKLRGQVAESSMADKEREEMVERLDLEIATRLGKGDEPLDASDLGKAPSATAESGS